MLVRTLVVIVIAVGGVACGSSLPSSPNLPNGSTGAGRSLVDGDWTLITVNGATLPAVLVAGDYQVEVLSHALTLAANGTLIESEASRETYSVCVSNPTKCASTVVNSTSSGTGTFIVGGDTVTLMGTFGRRTGTWSGTTMTVAVDGRAWVFRKG